MGGRVLLASFLAVTMLLTIRGSAFAETASEPNWLERDTLTGDWGGFRTQLQEQGIKISPRFTQYYQGMPSGSGDHDPQYGSKLDVLLNTDLNKLGLWKGLSMTVHVEYNSNNSLNGAGGTVAPVNTGLYFPGIEGADTFDLSSVFLGQKFGDSVNLLFGKINVVDLAATKPFMGGAGIDAFWNATFVAPPSGTVPQYLFGAMLSVKTEPATYGLWVYDPNSCDRSDCLDKGFNEGFTIRPTVEFPVTIAGLKGHQGFVFAYSNKPGTDLTTIDDMLVPQWPSGATTKDDRYYFAYTFDQYLYQSKEDPKQGFGLFGQFGISDGNPNRLYTSGFFGVGGMGLVPGRSRDNWGAGYFYDTISEDLVDSLASVTSIGYEQGTEVFYNFAVTPWFTVGADLQVISPALADKKAVFTGLRTVMRF